MAGWVVQASVLIWLKHTKKKKKEEEKKGKRKRIFQAFTFSNSLISINCLTNLVHELIDFNSHIQIYSASLQKAPSDHGIKASINENHHNHLVTLFLN